MLRSVLKTWAFIGLTAFLAACGGDDIQGFTDYTDLRLNQLEITGGTLLYAEVEVERFDPANLGPYRVELDSEESTSFSITAAAEAPNDVFLQLVETQKNSDGTNRITRFNSGDTLEVPVDEGSSLVYVEVVSRSTGGALRYNLTFNRESSSADLSEVQIFGVRSFQDSSNVVFSEEVKPNVFSYDVELSYRVCNTSFRAIAENQFTSVSINGDEVSFGDSIYLDLDVGSNLVTVDITSEDEENTQTYEFNLIRAEPTSSDLAKDDFLSSLSINSGRVYPEFRCNIDQINLTLGAEDDVVELVATAAQEDASILISPIVFDTQRGIWIVDNDENTQDLVSGQSYSGPLLTDLEFGETFIGVQVFSSDESSANLYPIIINRIERNLIFVNTAEALQSAMRSAEPGDQIIVAEGEYTGITSAVDSETGSGDPQAHFFSDIDGGSEESISSILLYGEGAGVTLLGDNTAENSVLKIAGDYWDLEKISVRDSGIGVEISNATGVSLTVVDATDTTDASIYAENSSDITVNGLIVSGVESSAITFNNVSQSNVTNFAIREVEGNAIVLSEGSSNNVLKNGDINQVGESAPGKAILIGSGAGVADGNRVEFVDFGRNIAEESIAITANGNNTYIQSNYFYSDNTALAPVDDRRLIKVDGGDVTISRNTFEIDSYDGGADDFDSVININVGETFTADIFDNLLAFDDKTLPFINVESAASVEVLSNIHDTGESPVNIGDISALAALPVFQIQSTVDELRCLEHENIEIIYDNGASLEADLVNLKPCMDVAEQRWVFHRDAENYVTISPEGMPELKMSYANLVFTYINEEAEEGEDPNVALRDSFLYLREDDDSILDNQFALRWKVQNYGDGTVSFSNRNDSARRIVESDLDPQEVDQDLLFVRERFEDEVSRFTLLPL